MKTFQTICQEYAHIDRVNRIAANVAMIADRAGISAESAAARLDLLAMNGIDASEVTRGVINTANEIERAWWREINYCITQLNTIPQRIEQAQRRWSPLVRKAHAILLTAKQPLTERGVFASTPLLSAAGLDDEDVISVLPKISDLHTFLND